MVKLFYRRWFGRRTKCNRWTTLLGVFLIYHLSSSYWHLPVDIIRYYEIQKRIAATEQKIGLTDDDVASCKVPKLDPYDASIRKYISRPDPLHCKRVQWDMTYLDEKGVLNVNGSEMKSSGYSDLECSARCYDQNTGVDDDTPLYGQWVRFDEKLSMGCQFVEVNCIRQLLRTTVYNYHFMNISRPPKPVLYSGDDPPKSMQSISEPLSIALIAIDSMSRSNMIRQMPLTYAYLRNNMSAVVFDSHSKIGDNTWVNLLAMTTGLRSVPTAEFAADLSQFEEQYFDDYAPYLWYNFSRAGYYTFWSEDRPDIHTFNYGIRKGFLRRPFDYYDRPYWTATWSSFVRKRSTGFCYNTVAEHKIQYDYLRRFIREHRNEKSFAILWSQALTHDFLNTVGLADVDTVDFLHSVRPHLNRTILFVLSDHGHRYDSIRQSVIGRLEARLPFMSMVVPEWFKRQYPEVMNNLKKNAKNRLTTQFDIFGTMVDILENVSLVFTMSEWPVLAIIIGISVPVQLQLLNKLNCLRSTILQSLLRKCLRLFRPIPAARTCFEARIPEEYCPCYSEIELPNDEPMVKRAANVLVKRVNRLLSKHQPPCAFIELTHIVQAFAFLPHRATMRDPQVANRVASVGFYVSYRVVVRTAPGDALLEGIVKHFVDDGALSMESDIERNNAYKNTSYCVKDSLLKKYCYCLKQDA